MNEADVQTAVKETLAKLVREQRSATDQKVEAFEALLNDVSTGIASLVQILEGQGETDPGAAIAKALAGLKFPEPKITVAAPNVTVEAPQVNIPPIEIPAAVVHVHERAAALGWDIDFKYDGPTTAPSGMRLTRINPKD